MTTRSKKMTSLAAAAGLAASLGSATPALAKSQAWKSESGCTGRVSIEAIDGRVYGAAAFSPCLASKVPSGRRFYVVVSEDGIRQNFDVKSFYSFTSDNYIYKAADPVSISVPYKPNRKYKACVMIASNYVNGAEFGCINK
ncbi:MAG: hypothetical protein V9E83_04500 [Baekduia sp.]